MNGHNQAQANLHGAIVLSVESVRRLNKVLKKSKQRLNRKVFLSRLYIALIPALYLSAAALLLLRTGLINEEATLYFALILFALGAYCFYPFLKKIDNTVASALLDKKAGTKSRLTNAIHLLENESSQTPLPFKKLILADATKHLPRINLKQAIPYPSCCHKLPIAGGIAAIAFGCLVTKPYQGMNNQSTIAQTPPPMSHANKHTIDKESQEAIDAMFRDLTQAIGNNKDERLQKSLGLLGEHIEDYKQGNMNPAEFWSKIKAFEELFDKRSSEIGKKAINTLSKFAAPLNKSKATKQFAEAISKNDWDLGNKALQTLPSTIAQTSTNTKALAKHLEKATQHLELELRKQELSLKRKLARQESKLEDIERAIRAPQNKTQKNELLRKKSGMQAKATEIRKEIKKTKTNTTRLELKQLASRTKELAKQLSSSDQSERTKQNSTMKRMAEHFKNISNDARRIRNAQKARTQLSDLKQALRRAKRKTKQGAQSKLGRNSKKTDFENRASGKSGRGGSKQRQDAKTIKQGKISSNGTMHGEGHEPNMVGSPTRKTGKTKDTFLQGTQTKGRSTRETIMTSAQSGFSKKDYKDVYAQYKEITEEAIAKENVPSGYRYLVKRYFKNIEPRTP